MNDLQKFEAKYFEESTKDKNIPEFRAGDTVKVNYRIVEGNKERVQAYQGVCIARKNNGINSSFTVRKVSNGEGIERVFPLYSPRIESIELVRKGVVRRAKLYYMRELSGKAARIREKLDFLPKEEREAIAKQAEQKSEEAKNAPEPVAEEAPKQAKKEEAAPKVEDKKAEAKEAKKEEGKSE